MPARRDFTYEDLWPWLGRLNLIAVDGDDARFVVFSEVSTRLYGREMTGKRLSEFSPQVLADAALADHRAFMAAGGVPMMSRVDITYDYREMRWTRLVLPLADDERTVKRYFVALHVDDVRPAEDSGIHAVGR